MFACGIRNLKPTYYQNVNYVKYSKAYSTYFFKNAFLLHIKCSWQSRQARLFYKTATIFSKLFPTSTFVFLLSLTTSKIILKHCKFKCGAAKQPRGIKNLFPDWLLPYTYKLWEKLWNRYHLDVFILATKFSDWIYQNMVVFKEVALIFFIMK